MNRPIKFRAWMPHDKTLRYNISVGRGKAIDDLDAFFRDTAEHGIVWMQSTGLFDKNGKEIYWGDVTEYEKDNIETRSVVAFDKASFTFMGLPLQEWGSADEFEVIGNIYENPELLKQ